MERRWILFFIISFMVIFLFSLRNAQKMAERKQAEEERAGQTELVTDDQTSDLLSGDDATSETVTALSEPPEIRQAQESTEPDVTTQTVDAAPTVTVQTGLDRITFSRLGAVPISWQILPSEYVSPVIDEDTGTTTVIELIPQVTNREIRGLPLGLEGYTADRFNKVVFDAHERTATDGTKILKFTSPPIDDVRVVKTYTFPPGDYVSHLTIEVINGASRTRLGRANEGWGIGWQGGFMQPESLSRLTGQVAAAAAIGTDLKVKKLKDGDDPIRYDTEVAWAGMERKYFTALLIPGPENPPSSVEMMVRQRDMTSEYLAKGVAAPMSVILGHPAVELQPDEHVSLEYSLLVGPKDYYLLKSLDVPMIEGALPASTVAFGQMPMGMNWIRPISLFLLNALRFFENLVHNWGWAIIVLVLIVKIILYPLSHWAIKNQARTMAEQAKIKPHLDALNKKYKDDPSKRSQEMMKLYREHNINPLGAVRGCFPMLLQMPIFFGLYVLLDQAVELRGQSFLWIADLSQPDRLVNFGGALPILGWTSLNILPFLMAGTQFLTSRLMSTNISDPMQRNMMVMMPVVFMIFLYNLPSGLMLYWTVQNIWQIGHTVLTKRYVAMHDTSPPGGATPAGAAT
ncbi:membrane protein insertase YidC [bacterium]|nr:membrane protein insertase YidC [bacterium]